MDAVQIGEGGDRDSLERGDHVVEHNEIYDFSKLATYTPAGYMYGVGNTFRYNDAHDAPHMAIRPGVGEGVEQDVHPGRHRAGRELTT
ncbi:hypothetical protein [Nonomuraea fuscirosea]|uniref:hypothetical protein n=1 Tax=Nonomuraea fuscirosea TaxID=1291556 RepID=UPI00344606F6